MIAIIEKNMFGGKTTVLVAGGRSPLAARSLARTITLRMHCHCASDMQHVHLTFCTKSTSRPTLMPINFNTK